MGDRLVAYTDSSKARVSKHSLSIQLNFIRSFKRNPKMSQEKHINSMTFTKTPTALLLLLLLPILFTSIKQHHQTFTILANPWLLDPKNKVKIFTYGNICPLGLRFYRTCLYEAWYAHPGNRHHVRREVMLSWWHLRLEVPARVTRCAFRVDKE